MTMRITWSSLATGDRCFHAAIYDAKGFRSTCHDHDFAECFVVLAPELLHQINGQEIVMKRGDAALIRPMDIHEFQLEKAVRGQALLNVAFPVKIMQNMRSRFESEALATSLFDRTIPKTIQLSDNYLTVILEQFARLQTVAPPGRLSLECFLLNLLLSDITEKLDGKIPDWLDRAYKTIQAPEHLRRGVAEFVRLCGRSPEHVSRNLKKYYGCTPTELITRQRLEHAALLLRSSNLSIDEIAEQCGFHNLSYFYRSFQQHYQRSPRRYRLHYFTRII